MSAIVLPLDFNPIRIALVREIERVTGLKVIEHEPETQDAPRPAKPYIGYKMTTPSARMGGDDDHRQVFNGPTPTTKWVAGGQRKMTVSFHCYGNTHEEAYNYLSLWQQALDQFTTQERLRRAKVAVWIIGNVADLSALLNTGYEGRAQMDVQLGIASNLVEDLSSIDTVEVEGTVDKDDGTVSSDFTVNT